MPETRSRSDPSCYAPCYDLFFRLKSSNCNALILISCVARAGARASSPRRDRGFALSPCFRDDHQEAATWWDKSPAASRGCSKEACRDEPENCYTDMLSVFTMRSRGNEPMPAANFAANCRAVRRPSPVRCEAGSGFGERHCAPLQLRRDILLISCRCSKRSASGSMAGCIARLAAPFKRSYPIPTAVPIDPSCPAHGSALRAARGQALCRASARFRSPAASQARMAGTSPAMTIGRDRPLRPFGVT
jgi:hypothetical protein